MKKPNKKLRKKLVKVIQPAPGKVGEQEVRWMPLEDVAGYFTRNLKRR